MRAVDYRRAMPRLLVVHHSPTSSMTRLTEAVVAGGNDDQLDVEVVVREALEAEASDVLATDGVVLGTPANFGYMSGALKHFFDRTFLEIGGALADDGSAGAGSRGTGTLPFGLYVHGRYDVTGAVRAVGAITGALPWRQAAAVLEVLGEVTEEHLGAAYELGGTVGALLGG